MADFKVGWSSGRGIREQERDDVIRGDGAAGGPCFERYGRDVLSGERFKGDTCQQRRVRSGFSNEQNGTLCCFLKRKMECHGVAETDESFNARNRRDVRHL